MQSEEMRVNTAKIASFTVQSGEAWGPCAVFSYRNHPQTNRPFVGLVQFQAG